jgi:phage FluMu gp28-like protein
VPAQPSHLKLVELRPYQQPVFADRHSGILVLHWSRQIGKTFTLAAWAIDRLLSRPGRLVTVLSNSRDNGAEFLARCVEICRLTETDCETSDDSASLTFENLRLELRIPNGKRVSRLKILAANPRTARGFSGDLILDEFAFHENSAAIWEAVEPILSSNKDFLCRIASTGNGKHNFFYRLAAPAAGNANAAGEISVSQSGIRLSRVTRTQAHELGVPIFDAHTRAEILPEAARSQALDKRAYDQNYECSFADENLTLLTHELISAAERENIGFISEQNWSGAQLDLLRSATGSLYVGFDVARRMDLSVISVVEKVGELLLARAILRIQDMRLPDQQMRLGEICRLARFQRAAIDMTGLGLGLFEYAQKEFGVGRIHGINFASTVPATRAIQQEGRARATVRVTEALALELLRAYEDRRIQQPVDARLRDDLRKPEKITTPGGRVSIAAARDAGGHADHFWSLALALEAAATGGGFGCEAIKLRARPGMMI